MRLSTDDRILRQMVNEYCEMPGLCLTARQAGHLWQLSSEQAARLLDDLVDSRFLIRTNQGAYARRFLGEEAPLPLLMDERISDPAVPVPPATRRVTHRA